MKKVVWLCDICKKEFNKGDKYFLCQEREIGTRNRFGVCKTICIDCYKLIFIKEAKI